MNNKQLLMAFLAQETFSGNNSSKSLSFLAKDLYSYRTLIASVDENVVKITSEKYSPTTSRQVSLLKILAAVNGYTISQ